MTKSFVYTKNIMPGQHVCAFADLLITNYGAYAHYMAFREKPCYTMPYNGSNYERYIKKNYPELSIDNEEVLLRVTSHAKKYEQLHREFSSYYSYPPNKDIVEHIVQLK